jgi:hypothetical protein
MLGNNMHTVQTKPTPTSKILLVAKPTPKVPTPVGWVYEFIQSGSYHLEVSPLITVSMATGCLL